MCSRHCCGAALPRSLRPQQLRKPGRWPEASSTSSTRFTTASPRNLVTGQGCWRASWAGCGFNILKSSWDHLTADGAARRGLPCCWSRRPRCLRQPRPGGEHPLRHDPARPLRPPLAAMANPTTTTTAGGVPLEKFRKDIPPGWRPGLSGYPLKVYFQKLKLWYRVAECPDECVGPLVAGRLGGAAQKIALELKLVRPDGSFDYGDAALVRLSTDQVIDPADGTTMLQHAIPSGVQALCNALKDAYGEADEIQTTRSLEDFFEYKRPQKLISVHTRWNGTAATKRHRRTQDWSSTLLQRVPRRMRMSGLTRMKTTPITRRTRTGRTPCGRKMDGTMTTSTRTTTTHDKEIQGDGVYGLGRGKGGGPFGGGCFICGSKWHMAADCPARHKGKGGASAYPSSKGTSGFWPRGKGKKSKPYGKSKGKGKYGNHGRLDTSLSTRSSPDELGYNLETHHTKPPRPSRSLWARQNTSACPRPTGFPS